MHYVGVMTKQQKRVSPRIDVSCAHCGESRSIIKVKNIPKHCRKCAPVYRDPTHYDCHRTHGMTRPKAAHGQAEKTGQSKVYRTYLDARKRCNCGPDQRWYRWYRDVEFRFESFEQFYAEVGDPPTPKHTLDRINNLGHYEPGNVRWADWGQQASNKRPRGSV
nr:unnamed protein product [uncultured Mediterranean phage uvMED]